MQYMILSLPAVVVLVTLFLIGVVVKQYYRVPPNRVMVVYGRKKPRLITNGGVFVWPILESYKLLDMTIMTIKTEKDEVYTVSGIPIQLDWVAQVQIDGQEVALRTAARAFLGKRQEEIRQILTETLSANFRAIVGQMTIETIHRDRDDFVQRVQYLASDDMAAMGTKILSMGIEEITDDEGYLEAMAVPQIASVKRDAQIAQAEAEREARVRAASARREAEQAELNAEREILQQREELQLRQVEVSRQVNMAQALSDQEVQQKRALAVEQQQEAEVLVPARAARQATEIQAEAERKRITITAEAQAEAMRTNANAKGDAVERSGRAEALALQAQKEAEARGRRAALVAEAEGKKAEAEGIRATLLAEAQGRRELAAATAAEGEINLRQFIVEQLARADVAKAQAVAEAMAGLGGNVKIVQFGGANGGGHTGNTLMDMLLTIPEVTEMFNAKMEALSGDDLAGVLGRIMQMMNALESSAEPPTNGHEDVIVTPEGRLVTTGNYEEDILAQNGHPVADTDT